MKTRALFGWTLVVTIASIAGCGSDETAESTSESTDNVSACQNFVDSIDCGSFDASSVVGCQQYEGYACDVSDYFDCLAEHFSCNGGIPDSSRWTACTALATCD